MLCFQGIIVLKFKAKKNKTMRAFEVLAIIECRSHYEQVFTQIFRFTKKN